MAMEDEGGLEFGIIQGIVEKGRDICEPHHIRGCFVRALLYRTSEEIGEGIQNCEIYVHKHEFFCKDIIAQYSYSKKQ